MMPQSSSPCKGNDSGKAAFESSEERPVPLEPDHRHIPPCLRHNTAWVTWRYERRESKWTKVPVNPRDGRRAKADVPKTWADFGRAEDYYVAHRDDKDDTRVDGIGYEFHANWGHGGVDLDDAIDPDTGEVKPWAREVLDKLNSYTELSPSGTGFKVYVQCDNFFPPPKGEEKQKQGTNLAYHDGEMEMYVGGRFFAVTGHRVEQYPATVEPRDAEVREVYAWLLEWQKQSKGKKPTGGQKTPANDTFLTDDQILAKLNRASNSTKFHALMNGDISGYDNDDSRADSALCCILAFYTKDPAQIERLFGHSRLAERAKWRDRADYRERTIRNALDVVKGGWQPESNGTHHQGKTGTDTPENPDPKKPPEPEVWPDLIDLGTNTPVPVFPVDRLPPWMAVWSQQVAEAIQVPVDLPGMLALAVCAAGVARKFRVVVRKSWGSEPLNLYVVVTLQIGERKSAAFHAALDPVEQLEKKAVAEAAPNIAEKECEHRILEGQLKQAEAQAAKADLKEREKKKQEARQLAKALADHEVPAEPQYICDDETPESVAKLLALHDGRMLQASPEGTPFEIIKGRYSERPNFDVFLKAHSGDTLRTGRVMRGREYVENPALTLALTVQPDVIAGLAEESALRGKGLLARPLYAVPASMVGSRAVGTEPVSESASKTYTQNVQKLWNLVSGQVGAAELVFSPEASQKMADFERKLEPRLGEGGDLAGLAGWGNKLAGAAARLSGILHMAWAVGLDTTWNTKVSVATVEDAIRIAEDYLIPHARTAFALMVTDWRVAAARKAVRWLQKRHLCDSVKTVTKEGIFTTKRDLHAGVWGGSRSVEEVEQVIALLMKHGYLRAVPAKEHPGRGRKASPGYEINPLAMTTPVEGSEN
jgi:hypothetical protein